MYPNDFNKLCWINLKGKCSKNRYLPKYANISQATKRFPCPVLSKNLVYPSFKPPGAFEVKY